MKHRVQIPTNITTKFIVLLFFPPIDLQMNARQGCTGGGGVNCTRTCCRAYSGTEHSLKRERIRESTIFSPTIYRGNDPFEHVPASTSREIKNFFSSREIKMQTFARLHKNIHIFIYIYTRTYIHRYTCVFKKRTSQCTINSSTYNYKISV